MSEEVWAVIKFKPKEGCDDEFRDCLKGMKKIIKENYPNSLSRIIKIDSGEYVHIIQYDTIDSIVDSQIDGLTWLDSVSHLLDKYENDSRTEAFSGLTIE
jgi:hypothetical protein